MKKVYQTIDGKIFESAHTARMHEDTITGISDLATFLFDKAGMSKSRSMSTAILMYENREDILEWLSKK